MGANVSKVSLNDNEIGIREAVISKYIGIRKKSSLTQKAVADKMGVSPQVVAKFESLKSTPTLKFLVKYANVLGQTISFDLINTINTEKNSQNVITDKVKEEKIFDIYNALNNDKTHMVSTDDICTPMECVKLMIDYIPSSFWKNENIKVLDPCCGNGNFGAYCSLKTKMDNIWFYDLNEVRLENCKRILNPKNIFKMDSLTIDNYGQWDLIMANPPYSGGGNKNQSLSKQFIEHSVKLVKNGGYLCFVAPNNWMSYNTNNTTLKSLLTEGSFVVIDNDIHKYFSSVGSSFTVFVWQKGVYNNKTYVKNNYVIKDEQHDVEIPNDLPFIPLYISQNTINIQKKMMLNEDNNQFFYRCDLHNFTKSDCLSDEKNNIFKYETIHTARKTRYAKLKQDIFSKWLIIVPLSTYYVPYIKHKVNVTQSVGYMAFDTKKSANEAMKKITQSCYKFIIHLTRYGNFNNIMVLKHLNFRNDIDLTEQEIEFIEFFVSKIAY